MVYTESFNLLRWAQIVNSFLEIPKLLTYKAISNLTNKMSFLRTSSELNYLLETVRPVTIYADGVLKGVFLLKLDTRSNTTAHQRSKPAQIKPRIKGSKEVQCCNVSKASHQMIKHNRASKDQRKYSDSMHQRHQTQPRIKGSKASKDQTQPLRLGS